MVSNEDDAGGCRVFGCTGTMAGLVPADHAGGAGLRDEKGASKVDGVGAADVGLDCLKERLVGHDPSGIDVNVDAAEVGLDLGDALRDLGLRCDAALVVLNFDAVPVLQIEHQQSRRRLSENVHDRDVAFRGRESICECQAQPASGTGDNSRLP